MILNSSARFGGASRTSVVEGGGALWRARRSISPREKRRPLGGGGSAPARCLRPSRRRPGPRTRRQRAVPRATVASMPPAARKKQQYECAAKEFELTREAMRALNIEADFKGLPLFDKWSRYTERRQDHVITDNRKHNKNRIARAKAAAEAAAASEAGSSQARPSVRDRSNTRSPMLAMLTLCCLAQRSGSLTALARWSRARRRTRSWPPS